MSKDKFVICTIGTSISNGCELQREYFKPEYAWDADTKEFESQIRTRVNELQSNVRAISAELNSLDRLDLTSTSKVVLLATDNAASKACAQELKKAIKELLSISDDNIEIKRIKGLQVHDVALLKEQGFRELVTTILSYLADENISYQYDLILNPTGGYKGIVPFLTILGMLYGKPNVYIFEHAEQLIHLPPLPFTFDIEIYNRVAPALKRIDEETAINEQEYFSCITDYTESEKHLFSSFIEPLEGNLVTISPLAEVLLSIENRAEVPQVSSQIIEELQNDNSLPALALKRLIKNSVNPLWRQQHSEKWHSTDLIVIKQNATAERLAGFVKDNSFHVAYAFRNHEIYERDLPKYNTETARALVYKEWPISDNVGSELQSDNVLIRERDELLTEKAKNEKILINLQESLDLAELEVQELTEAATSLNDKIIELEKEKILEQNNCLALEEGKAALQKKLAEIQQQTFWQRVLYVFKASN